MWSVQLRISLWLSTFILSSALSAQAVLLVNPKDLEKQILTVANFDSCRIEGYCSGLDMLNRALFHRITFENTMIQDGPHTIKDKILRASKGEDVVIRGFTHEEFVDQMSDTFHELGNPVKRAVEELQEKNQLLDNKSTAISSNLAQIKFKEAIDSGKSLLVGIVFPSDSTGHSLTVVGYDKKDNPPRRFYIIDSNDPQKLNYLEATGNQDLFIYRGPHSMGGLSLLGQGLVAPVVGVIDFDFNYVETSRALTPQTYSNDEIFPYVGSSGFSERLSKGIQLKLPKELQCDGPDIGSNIQNIEFVISDVSAPKTGIEALAGAVIDDSLPPADRLKAAKELIQKRPSLKPDTVAVLALVSDPVVRDFVTTEIANESDSSALMLYYKNIRDVSFIFHPELEKVAGGLTLTEQIWDRSPDALTFLPFADPFSLAGVDSRQRAQTATWKAGDFVMVSLDDAATIEKMDSVGILRLKAQIGIQIGNAIKLSDEEVSLLSNEIADHVLSNNPYRVIYAQRMVSGANQLQEPVWNAIQKKEKNLTELAPRIQRDILSFAPLSWVRKQAKDSEDEWVKRAALELWATKDINDLMIVTGRTDDMWLESRLVFHVVKWANQKSILPLDQKTFDAVIEAVPPLVRASHGFTSMYAREASRALENLRSRMSLEQLKIYDRKTSLQ